MKTAENLSASGALASPSLTPLSGRIASPKILAAHLEKLAVVYVRQSTPKQVLENRESTARQYAFAD
jgi:hypothetical protein